jgi:ATP-dependent protease HslVU (ClpYQ) peptidase subunit
MSVVAVKVTEDEIVIGADSILVTGFTQQKDKLAKLNQVNDMIIGDVGDAQEGSLFLLFVKTRKPREASEDGMLEFFSDFQDWMKQKTELSEIENSYIIIYQKKVFLVEGFYIKEIKDYTAIGAGMDYALTALHLGHSVKKSIEVACELSIYCEKPINIIKISKR